MFSAVVLLGRDTPAGRVRLELMQTFSAGTEYHDDAALADLGVAVANNSDANAVAVAGHANALMIAVKREPDVTHVARLACGGAPRRIVRPVTRGTTSSQHDGGGRGGTPR